MAIRQNWYPFWSLSLNLFSYAKKWQTYATLGGHKEFLSALFRILQETVGGFLFTAIIFNQR